MAYIKMPSSLFWTRNSSSRETDEATTAKTPEKNETNRHQKNKINWNEWNLLCFSRTFFYFLPFSLFFKKKKVSFVL